MSLNDWLIEQQANPRPLLLKISGVLFLGLAVWLGYGWWNRPHLKQNEGLNIAAEFLQSIRKGAVDQAWESTTAEFKSAFGRENFRKWVRNHPVVMKDLEFVKTQPTHPGDLPREFLFTPASEASKPDAALIQVLLARDDRGWRVERLLVDRAK